MYYSAVIDYHIGMSCKAKHAVETVQRALGKRKQFEEQQCPTIRTDNGPQFISHAIEEASVNFGVEHDRIPSKTPNKKSHFESFHAILEDENFRWAEFYIYSYTHIAVSDFIAFYNERRIHGSIHDLSPKQFQEVVKTGQVLPVVVKV